jgi:hypothetical protein
VSLRNRVLSSVVMVVAVTAAAVAAGGSWAFAGDTDPVAGSGPSSSGMPGAALVQQILSWGQWLGMAACALVIIYGAATWHGFAGASAGRSVAGKTFVMAGAVGLLLIGLLPTMVSMLFGAGRS